MTVLLWIVLPYCALGSFVLGHIWRFRRDRFRPAPDADRAERYGAIAFRLGASLVIAARLADLFASGPHDHPPGGMYVLILAVEVVALPTAAAGAVMLILPSVIAGTHRGPVTPVDRITLPVLTAMLLSGVLIRLDPNSTADGYRTAETLFSWARSLPTPHPNPDAMADAPALYQARGLILVLLLGIWPYTRLADLFAAPIAGWVPRVFRRQRRLSQRATVRPISVVGGSR
ncbi:respiratory nitrate reductase subunit gamma [Nocardia wallacei]|uniref:respiratory nitrate reductase subunit gamma n=1 Tax=Nocardia wallacei TaxID=480035 RepID=UPI002457C25E|nr:respiratory nitrate reductase subunit gamma [Nocardia wallacei]